MRDKLGDIIRLQHIIDAIEETFTYTQNCNFESFCDNSMMKFAVIKQIEIIGEAANHISEEIMAKATEVDWIKIIAARNIFVHEYFGIDDRILWDIIQTDLPVLKKQITKVLELLK